jgi:hypothetical protein
MENGSATSEIKPGPHASQDHVGLRARARAGVGILGVNGARGKTGEGYYFCYDFVQEPI